MTGARPTQRTPLSDRLPASRQRTPSERDARPLPTKMPTECPRSGHDRHDTSLEHTSNVATTVVRSPARPVQVMGDWCRQVSWLAAQAHRLRLPAGCPAVASGATLAAYSCGGSHGVEAQTSHRVPFSPAKPRRRDRTRTVTQARAKQTARTVVNRLHTSRRRFAFACCRAGNCQGSDRPASYPDATARPRVRRWMARRLAAARNNSVRETSRWSTHFP